jgi:hypothetical protein
MEHAIKKKGAVPILGANRDKSSEKHEITIFMGCTLPSFWVNK